MVEMNEMRKLLQYRQLVTSLAILTICLLSSIMVFPNSASPPDEHTGAPGESDCSSCHGNLNVGPGSITLNAPDIYGIGDDQIDIFDISVKIEHPGQSRWGFEVAVLDSAGNSVGLLELTDTARTQLSQAPNGRIYIKNTEVGTDAGMIDSSLNWNFKWWQPGKVGGATFYVSAVAANNDGTVSGDLSFTDTAFVEEIVSQHCCFGTAGDANGDFKVNIADITYLIAYIFASGLSPPCCQNGSPNGDTRINIADMH